MQNTRRNEWGEIADSTCTHTSAPPHLEREGGGESMRVAERTEKAETTSSQVLHTIGSVMFRRGQRPRPDFQSSSPIRHRTIPNPAVHNRPGARWGAQHWPFGGPIKDLRWGSPRQMGGSEERPGDLASDHTRG